jgi:hypothetical protein
VENRAAFSTVQISRLLAEKLMTGTLLIQVITANQ